ncbi:MAG: holin, partial [Clostridia bacterium]|nr:holin [Clostridia bacterium]
VDFITGLIVAGVFKRSNKSKMGALDSRAGFKGLLKKCMILLMVILGTVLDLLVGTDTLVRTAVILFYIGNEGLSIVENFGLMGMPVPKKLRDALEVLKQKGDGDNENLS